MTKKAHRELRKRRKSVGPNPYFPALLSISERWAPEQVAQVLTVIDAEVSGGEWRLSREIILRLSRLYQKPGVAVAAPEAPISGEETEDRQLGKCERCGKPASLTFEDEGGGVQRVCNICYGMALERTSKKGEADAKQAE